MTQMDCLPIMTAAKGVMTTDQYTILWLLEQVHDRTGGSWTIWDAQTSVFTTTITAIPHGIRHNSGAADYPARLASLCTSHTTP